MTFITRTVFLEKLTQLLETFPIVALLGARQVGKSTLARMYLQENGLSCPFYDLESDRDLAALREPQWTLEQHKGLIVMDEIQRMPSLFPLLRHMVDTHDQKYLILGSASQDLIHQSTESLAGRIAYLTLPPLLQSESQYPVASHLVRGGMPSSLLASSDTKSLLWRQAYIKTFLERDLRMLGFDVAPSNIRRFWQALAHHHGQLFQPAELAATLGSARRTITSYMKMLEGAMMLFELKPWHENLQKRQVKKAKIYFQDPGIFNRLAGIETMDDLLAHPRLGSVFEGWAIQEIMHREGYDPEDMYFWRTSNGAELDLLVNHKGKRHGYEFKFTSTPTVTKSMHSAYRDLKLDSLTVITPKGRPHKLNNFVDVRPLEETQTQLHLHS